MNRKPYESNRHNTQGLFRDAVFNFDGSDGGLCSSKEPQHLVANPDFGSAIATQTLDCEGKIRQQMDEKKILIQNNVSEFSADVEIGNKLVLEANDKKYSVVQVQNDFTDFRLAHEKVTHESSVRIEYSLSRPDKESKDLMKLQVEIATIDQHKSLLLRQEIRFDSACTPRVSETNQELLLRTSAESYKYSMVRVTADGGREIQSDDFALPAGGVLANFFTDVDSLAKMPDAGYVNLGAVGLFEFKATKADSRAINEFGLDLALKSKTFELVREGKRFEIFMLEWMRRQELTSQKVLVNRPGKFPVQFGWDLHWRGHLGHLRFLEVSFRKTTKILKPLPEK